MGTFNNSDIIWDTLCSSDCEYMSSYEYGSFTLIYCTKWINQAKTAAKCVLTDDLILIVMWQHQASFKSLFPDTNSTVFITRTCRINASNHWITIFLQSAKIFSRTGPISIHLDVFLETKILISLLHIL